MFAAIDDVLVLPIGYLHRNVVTAGKGGKSINRVLEGLRADLKFKGREHVMRSGGRHPNAIDASQAETHTAVEIVAVERTEISRRTAAPERGVVVSWPVDPSIMRTSLRASPDPVRTRPDSSTTAVG